MFPILGLFFKSKEEKKNTLIDVGGRNAEDSDDDHNHNKMTPQ